jgi:hypothetical protein
MLHAHSTAAYDFKAFAAARKLRKSGGYGGGALGSKLSQMMALVEIGVAHPFASRPILRTPPHVCTILRVNRAANTRMSSA